MNNDHIVVIVDTQERQDVSVMHPLLQRAVITVLQQHEIERCEVSVVLTSNEEIQQLNARFRQQDEPTDVLSFPMDGDAAASDEHTGLLLGDVVISVEKAFEQADEYGHSPQREFTFLAVHGVLHLLGYDHDTEEERVNMRQAEERALKTLQLER